MTAAIGLRFGYLIRGLYITIAEDAGYSAVFAVSVFALYGVIMLLGQSSGDENIGWSTIDAADHRYFSFLLLSRRLSVMRLDRF
jgi:hypothetical protein